MANWGEGYVTETNYTYGYYQELSPYQTSIPFLMANVALPKIKNACELGFGQGMSVNIHAAASDVSWYANDFNPNHVSFAKDLAEHSEANVHLSDEAFAQFCQRTDLPDFEFIALHGIWSWISDANREVIVDFISRKLKVGGVLYISYNSLPGWSAYAPVRHAMFQHHKSMSSSGQPMSQRVNQSLDFTKQLFELTTNLNQQVPKLKERLEGICDKDRDYIAHEYLNEDWQPMYYSDMQDWLSSAKLDYVCSPNFTNDFQVMNFSTEQIEFLNQISDRNLSQTVQDFMLNRQFRKDYWVKGARILTDQDKHDAWNSLSFLLTIKREDLKFNVGRVNLKEEIYEPILDVLNDYKVHTFADLEAYVSKKNMPLDSLYESLAILNGKGDVQVVFRRDDDLVKEQCHKLNKRIINLSMNNKQINFLASPLTASAISVNYVNQIMLSGYQHNDIDNAKELAEFTWGVLQKHGRRMMSEGKALETPEENLAELEERAQEFFDFSIKIFQELELI